MGRRHLSRLGSGEPKAREGRANGRERVNCPRKAASGARVDCRGWRRIAGSSERNCVSKGNRSRVAAICVGSIFLVAGVFSSLAQPKLVVKMKGTNELEFTLSPIVPDGYYEVIARSNSPDGHWIALTDVLGGSNQSVTLGYKPEGNDFKVADLARWTLIAVPGRDSDGDGLPDYYEELVVHTDPWWPDTGNFGISDGYKDPDGDNWVNLQELQNGTDPLEWNPPPPPSGVGCNVHTNSAVLTWTHIGCTLPDYFEVERSDRKFNPEFQAWMTNRSSRFRRPGGRPPEQFVNEPPRVVARVSPKTGLPGLGGANYKYVATNVDTFFQPSFRVRGHYTPPVRRTPVAVDTSAIRQTIRQVTATPTTNGYELTVQKPAPLARYLLLSRSSEKSRWRASGYFVVTTTNSTAGLHVDARGMMAAADQHLVPLPEVRFVESSPHLEFTAGSGEDSDGDGLPDIYEVLVTKTNPARSISNESEMLDGLADPDGDGWPSVEEFSRRTDPLESNSVLPGIELKRPTSMELMRTLAEQLKSDLPFECKIEIRKKGSPNYEPLETSDWAGYAWTLSVRTNRSNLDFDVKLSRTPRSRLGRPPQESGGP